MLRQFELHKIERVVHYNDKQKISKSIVFFSLLDRVPKSTNFT